MIAGRERIRQPSQLTEVNRMIMDGLRTPHRACRLILPGCDGERRPAALRLSSLLAPSSGGSRAAGSRRRYADMKPGRRGADGPFAQCSATSAEPALVCRRTSPGSCWPPVARSGDGVRPSFLSLMMVIGLLTRSIRAARAQEASAIARPWRKGRAIARGNSFWLCRGTCALQRDDPPGGRAVG